CGGGLSFLVGGLILFFWWLAEGDPSPSTRQWRSVAVVSALIFVFDYGLLFWAEQRVPSGLAAVMMATIPLFMGLAEIMLLGTQRLTVRLALAFLIGLLCVPVLISGSLNLVTPPLAYSLA